MSVDRKAESAGRYRIGAALVTQGRRRVCASPAAAANSRALP